MISYRKDAPVSSYSQTEYERAVVNSSLWAASGDALGWVTELSRGTNAVKRRTGKEKVTEPVAWRRLIGGRSGVKVDLPAGTYSDDTQLRLCVSRSIQGNGFFDVEAFAKIEVTSWQGYCLGAGIGSKAAAANLSKRGVNWFSNFFDSGRQNYTAAGGNGAAMRIQPHVWSAKGSRDEMILSVLQDAIVTHGNPHGFCGAVFHALCIWHVLVEQEIPPLKVAEEFVSCMGDLPAILESDSQLAGVWRPFWEGEAGMSFECAIRDFQKGALEDISLISDAFDALIIPPNYRDVLHRIGCLTEKYRGSGFKTALAALALSLLHSPETVADAMIQAANELDSDTDTIATMAGALLGALAKHEPSWNVQDIEYVRLEAKRMAAIASGATAHSFPYPDVALWKPPTNQSDAVVMWRGALALIGLGALEPKGQEYSSGSAVWQWFTLPFGQSVLAKRRKTIRSFVNGKQMPSEPLVANSKSEETINDEAGNSLKPSIGGQRNSDRSNENVRRQTITHEKFPSLDEITKAVIDSGFDDATIGRAINQCIDDNINAERGIERVIGLSAIIAKARIARSKQKRSQA